jgi:hypothetical protein
VVNDEGVISGWTVVGVPGQGGSTINALTVWDRKFKPTLPGWSVPNLEFTVLDMNNRGQILALIFSAGYPGPGRPEDVLVIDPDGTVETPCRLTHLARCSPRCRFGWTGVAT